VGTAITSGQVLYDSQFDSFRVAYYQGGAFRMRRLNSKGEYVSDKEVVPGVSLWTYWGVVQHPPTGHFVFAWTYYPDTAIRIAIVSATGALITTSEVVMTLPPGANARQNVQIGWHSSTKSFLIVWDEKSGSDVNIRGTMLNENFVSLGPDFELVGGPGTQSAVRMASRAAGKGYVFSYSTQTTNGAPTKIRFVDHSGSSQLSFELIPDGQTSTSSTLWYDQGLERGVVQWLGSDGTYHQALFSETGPVGSPLALDGLGGVVGAVVGAPEKNSLRAVFMAGGVVDRKSVV
jgi:hypothetical protein